MIDESLFPVSRDVFVEKMHANNAFVRKYFHPGCHSSSVYGHINCTVDLSCTDLLSSRVVVFPNGLSVNKKTIRKLGKLIRGVTMTSRHDPR